MTIKERWVNAASNKELDQYLSDGIAQLEAEHRKQIEALQAECDLLRKHLQNLIDQTTPLEPDPGNPMWSRRIQLDEVIAERDQLRSECENLRKDAERYRWLRDPCSGAERVVMYGRGDYGRGLMTYTMLDKAIDAAMEATK